MRIPDRFSQREDGKAWFLVLANGLVIVSLGSVAWHLDNLMAYAVAFILVGARGQACYILQHEAMHQLLFKKKATNVNVGIVLSAMIGTRYFDGRRFHMKHHREVGHQDDPNEIWHNVEKRPPGLPVGLFFLKQLLGGRVFGLARRVLDIGWSLLTGTRQPGEGRDQASRSEKLLMHDRSAQARRRRESMVDLGALATVQALLFAGITLASAPWVYFALYVAPLVTLTAFFEAVRAFSEHVSPGESPGSEAARERCFYMRTGKLERFFISQFNFHYHHVHHLYPNVVTFKVRELHEWLLENDPRFADQFIERSSYLKTALDYLRNRPIPGSGTGYPLPKAT